MFCGCETQVAPRCCGWHLPAYFQRVLEHALKGRDIGALGRVQRALLMAQLFVRECRDDNDDEDVAFRTVETKTAFDALAIDSDTHPQLAELQECSRLYVCQVQLSVEQGCARMRCLLVPQ